MEWLTERWGEDDVWVKGHDYVTAAHRLADYEDTRLTPELVQETAVYCKDCKYRTRISNCEHPRQHGILPTAYPYDFCSYSERKDEAHEP